MKENTLRENLHGSKLGPAIRHHTYVHQYVSQAANKRDINEHLLWSLSPWGSLADQFQATQQTPEAKSLSLLWLQYNWEKSNYRIRPQKFKMPELILSGKWVKTSNCCRIEIIVHSWGSNPVSNPGFLKQLSIVGWVWHSVDRPCHTLSSHICPNHRIILVGMIWLKSKPWINYWGPRAPECASL